MVNIFSIDERERDVYITCPGQVLNKCRNINGNIKNMVRHSIQFLICTPYLLM